MINNENSSIYFLIMTTKEKKELYEEIMWEVAKVVKSALTEDKKKHDGLTRRQRSALKRNDPEEFKYTDATKEDFIDYINNYVDFVSVLPLASGKHYLDVCGRDGGNVKENGLEVGPKFRNPESIDEWLKTISKMFKEPNPEMTFSEYLKKKYKK